MATTILAYASEPQTMATKDVSRIQTNKLRLLKRTRAIQEQIMSETKIQLKNSTYVII